MYRVIKFDYYHNFIFYKSLAGWTFAFNDYYVENITRYIDNPYFQLMANIVDPYCKNFNYLYEILFLII